MKYSLLLLIFLSPIVAHAAIDDCMTRTSVPDEKLNLKQIVDLGLCRNPQTAAAFLSYESARMSKNAGYADYLPSVNASANASLPYRNEEWGDWSYGASLSASYLIFDFGKRFSDVKQSIYSWRAAGFDYDESVQNYVYGIIGAYYALLNADADVESAEMLRAVAQTARDTAQKKFQSGSVAKADVLKADTTLASRDLDLERAKNNREIAKGTLLAKLSFPANQEIEIADLPSEIGTPQETKSLEEFLKSARKVFDDKFIKMRYLISAVADLTNKSQGDYSKLLIALEQFDEDDIKSIKKASSDNKNSEIKDALKKHLATEQN